MTFPDTILRPDEHGQPDDFVITDVSMFRMERMDTGSWWLACYRGNQRVSLFLNADSPIACTISEDDFGLVDDGGNDEVNRLIRESEDDE